MIGGAEFQTLLLFVWVEKMSELGLQGISMMGRIAGLIKVLKTPDLDD